MRGSMVQSKVKPKIHLHLHASDLTLLHRAGMAGLWMTLKQLEYLYPSPGKRCGDLTWSLTPHSISFHWQGEDFSVLDWLFKQSFQISDKGLIWLTGLNPEAMELSTQITIHKGITGTFLQHSRIFKSSGLGSLPVTVEDKEVLLKFSKANSYAHQDFAKNLCDKKGQLSNKPIGIKSWLYPGATVRHSAFTSKTKFFETTERVLALVFAPVACLYFILRSRLRDKRAQYALVIPEVIDLQAYATRRKQLTHLGYKNFSASNAGDAGLRFLTQATTLEIAQTHRIRRCQVITYGEVAWSSFQKTPTCTEVMEANEDLVRDYRLSCNYFPDKTITNEKGTFIAVSFVRELIAENLAQGFPWWANWATRINTSELFQQIIYEREGLYHMVQNTQWDEQGQKLFVEACHEALRRTYAKVYSRTKEGDYAQIERKRERIRSELVRCKNAAHFRQFITDFWSRAGMVTILQDHWQELLPLTTGAVHWKMGRDLALLALASYKKNSPSETESEENSDAEVTVQ